MLSGSNKALGLVVATCCHHACSWNDYTGKEWLLDQGFTSSDFDILVKWSAWAHTLSGYRTASSDQQSSIMGDHNNNDEIEKSLSEELAVVHDVPLPSSALSQGLGLTYEELGNLGRMTKRVLDEGRVHYLKNLNMDVQQVNYCDKELSPENVLIVAVANSI